VFTMVVVAAVVAAVVGTVKSNGEDEVVLKVGVEIDEATDAQLILFRSIVVPPPLVLAEAADVAVKNPAGVVDVAVPVDGKVSEAKAPVCATVTVTVTAAVTVTAPELVTVGAKMGDKVVEVSGNTSVAGIVVNETEVI